MSRTAEIVPVDVTGFDWPLTLLLYGFEYRVIASQSRFARFGAIGFS
jgi:hypothetical protein